MSINDEIVENNCSYCGETIPLDSHRCSYCGSILRKMQTDPDYRDSVYKGESSLSNGFKVFIAVLYTLIPGIGQIAGIIHGFAMVNSKGKDKRSFGKALIVAMVSVFIIYCVILYIGAVALITLYYYIT